MYCACHRNALVAAEVAGDAGAAAAVDAGVDQSARPKKCPSQNQGMVLESLVCRC